MNDCHTEQVYKTFLISGLFCAGERLLSLKQRLQLAMAQHRKEERARKAELNRLDNEECGEEEEEVEDLTDESEAEEVQKNLLFFPVSALKHHHGVKSNLKKNLLISQGVDDLLGGDDRMEEEEEGSVSHSNRSASPVTLARPSPSTPDLVNTDGTLMLFPGNSRTG